MLPEEPTSRRPEQSAEQRAAAEYRVGWKMAGIGMEVAAQVAGGALLGWGVDALFGTSWGVLAGAIIGLVVGMWTLIKGALKLNQRLNAMSPRARPRNELGLPPTGAMDAEEQKDELPSWREEWDEWKEGESDDERAPEDN